ncbi:MAG: hypothetical protein V7724_06420 [Sediminicola sp.]|tara:strand:- start:51849 stop:52190 length:342 start_codon:yes stop_codon:yes gene_type:complete
MRTKLAVGVIFLSLQIVLIIHSRFIPERFFCWAPYDEHSYIDISVKIKGKQLTPEQIGQRYHHMAKGYEARSIYNVFDIVEQYENTYGKKDRAEVIIEYSTNGHNKKQWNYSN